MLQALGDLGGHCLGAFRRDRSSGLQPRQNILNPFGLEDVDRERGANELGGAHMGEQSQQRLPEPVDIGKQDRLGVPPELLPSQLLHQFLQRADAAGKSDEGIRVLEHQPFALVHVGGDDHFLDARQRVLAHGQEVRNDARHHAAMIEH